MLQLQETYESLKISQTLWHYDERESRKGADSLALLSKCSVAYKQLLMVQQTPLTF